MNIHAKRVITVAAIAAFALAGCGGGSSGSGVKGAQKTLSSSRVLVGAGSTLVAPLVGQWTGDYSKKKGVTVSYAGIGSGGGIAQVTARTVDFGASDAPLTADQKAAAKDVVQLPWALGATVVAVNVPGVTSHLKLTGPVVADIFLGKVTSWKDPAIAALNPGVRLPDLKIVPVYRSDASGDTYAFTDYLSKVSPTWAAKTGGASTEISFPTGTGAKGNSGIVASLQQTKGSISYVGIAHAKGEHLNYALLRNAAGRYPEPSPQTIAAAAAGASFRAGNSVSITNPPASAPNAYPLSTFTYVLVPRSSSKIRVLKPFLRYAVTQGQSFAEGLSFAPLPKPVQAKAAQVIGSL